MKTKIIAPLFLYSVFVFLMLGALGAQAQFEGLNVVLPTASNVSMRVTPQNPGPNQGVSIRLESFSTDLNRATISWFIDGALDKRGVGLTSHTLTAKALGGRTSVSVVVTTSDGSVIEERLNIVPTDVDIVWEALTYTPPFYKGKALYSHQSTIRAVALPYLVTSNGTRLGASSLIYSWKVNGKVDQAASGFGKNIYEYSGSIISRPVTLEVTVASNDQSLKAIKRSTITPVEPEVALYEESPLYGVMSARAINQFTLSENEVIFTAVPYFFSVDDRDDFNLQYRWSMNGREVPFTGKSVTFRREQDGGGVANISLRVEHLQNILQGGRGRASVSFTERSSAGFENF